MRNKSDCVALFLSILLFSYFVKMKDIIRKSNFIFVYGMLDADFGLKQLNKIIAYGMSRKSFANKISKITITVFEHIKT